MIILAWEDEKMHLKENLYGADPSEDFPSFEQLIAENEQKILNLIYGMTGNYHLAQDLTQEAFIKAFRSIKTFNGKAKFSTWLYRIAVNVTIDYQRKGSVHKENPAEEIESNFSHCSTSSDPDKACQKNAIRDILFKTIAQLPEQQREVFILREINGCSTKEAADIIGCTQALVKWRLHKARSSLRKTLKSNNQYKNVGTFSLNSLGIE